ncbi:MAG: hypothetical protein GXO00_03460 [Candidatus Diapherotrites archaeon]|nr:hypothetical protein [Candidatus Diapherotrites archaeon]
MPEKKGSRAERELMRMLWQRGYAVVRSAGSGISYSPDVVAIKDGVVLAFECKAWKKREVVIEEHQMQKMLKWAQRSGATLYLAWKYPYRGWFFIPVELLNRRNGKYVINIEEAEALSYEI